MLKHAKVKEEICIFTSWDFMSIVISAKNKQGVRIRRLAVLSRQRHKSIRGASIMPERCDEIEKMSLIEALRELQRLELERLKRYDECRKFYTR